MTPASSSVCNHGSDYLITLSVPVEVAAENVCCIFSNLNTTLILLACKKLWTLIGLFHVDQPHQGPHYSDTYMPADEPVDDYSRA